MAGAGSLVTAEQSHFPTGLGSWESKGRGCLQCLRLEVACVEGHTFGPPQGPQALAMSIPSEHLVAAISEQQRSITGHQ